MSLFTVKRRTNSQLQYSRVKKRQAIEQRAIWEQLNNTIASSETLSLTLREECRIRVFKVGLDGLGVTCSPRDPRFAGSNPDEVGWISSRRKNSEHKSSGRDFNLGVPSLRFQAR